MKYRMKTNKKKDRKIYANTANRVHYKNVVLATRGGRHL